MKKILIITTGGTIAMKYDPQKGVVPDTDLVTFLKTFPQIRNIADIDVYEFTNLPSPHLTPDKILELVKIIREKHENYDGFVITHGTDTLEESSYLVNLLIDTLRPIVFTAAMRSGSELGLDGPRNIVGALRVACDPRSVGRGVLVVMNDEIHFARDVVKTDTGKTDAFDTPNFGMLGIIDIDKVIYYRYPLVKESISTDVLDTNIYLIKSVMGMDGKLLEACIQNNAKAVVIEAFGRGNVPPSIIPAIRKALDKNILIVVVSRTYTGRVLPEYGYIGGGKYLNDMGVILGGDIRGPKMRMKLMALFGKLKDPNLVREYLLNNTL